ncbi:MarR family winged helix-turn-helix transcriptional regulator [Amycolatopsis sp. CA-161197]|uniref:MarR family winged helix-turn-helix transcriptional regulator n=1 Tax=Amycolatopsis sp. CA-161197 TaxID=3239922 RepID=UPI003D8A72CE
MTPEPNLADVVARLRRAMRRAARTADPDNTLSVAQLELLSCLAENPGARPSRVAQLLKLAPNSVTTMVTGLRARDLVTRTSGSEDRRTVELELTESGQAAVDRYKHHNAEILAAAIDRLHPAWRHLIASAIPALAELVGAIDQLAETGPPHPERP